MNVLADEGVDGPVVERLRHDGHVVLYIAETAPGISDEEILRKANANMSLLVTADQDFGEMVFRHNLLSTGGHEPAHQTGGLAYSAEGGMPLWK